MKDYSGKVVVVTGGAHGIGAEIARRYAQAGAAIALFDIEAPALETMADELRTTGATVLAVHGDVADYAAVGDFADRVFESFGRVDLVFSNAGVISAGTIWEEPVED